ncbi:uncharacterized protein LOC143216295 [Lasioglossum baleicum]|uniref:uncharacterized protein LOC143216295 n=1 Tax=Lasioglossum baleicum TaxID=434251 RepID=UPI003FCDC9D9
MANERYRLIKESLKKLLQEGCKCLHIVDIFYNRARSDYSEFQRVLHIMDNYSRHKSELQRDMDLLIDFTVNVRLEGRDHDNYDIFYDDIYDIYFDDDDDYDYDEETETGDDEETVSDVYDEWLNQLTLAIRDRKNALTQLELNLLKIVESYSNLMEVQSQLNSILENYCGRVVTVLKQIENVENRLKDTRLANRFREKRKKLVKILAHITEKQKFFWGDHTSSAMETA